MRGRAAYLRAMRTIFERLRRLRFMRRRRLQVAALPWRHEADGRVRVLLVTSRGTGRWIVPKGWPMTGKRSHQAAAQEAWEEAGVRGEIEDRASGAFGYLKTRGGDRFPCRVEVFALRVTEELPDWPERSQRDRRWAPPEEAARMVQEKALARLILALENRAQAADRA